MGAAAETEMVGLAQLTRRSKKSSVGKISALKLCLIWSERCRNNETPPKNVVSLAEKTKPALLSTCCCVLFQRLRADSSIEKSTWGTDYGGKCACSGKKKHHRVTIIKKLICGWKLACTIARETMILITVALWMILLMQCGNQRHCS